MEGQKLTSIVLCKGSWELSKLQVIRKAGLVPVQVTCLSQMALLN